LNPVGILGLPYLFWLTLTHFVSIFAAKDGDKANKMRVLSVQFQVFSQPALASLVRAARAIGGMTKP
jgi:hypothetical protein